VTNEILSVVAMHGNVKGKNLYDALTEKLFSIADRRKFDMH